MAAIGITVSKEGFWSVGLDNFEWTGLVADGHSVEKVTNEWNFTQSTLGDFKFIATAEGTQFLNEQQHWSIQCGAVYYCLILDYRVTKNEQGNDNGFILTGRGFALNEPIHLTNNSIPFSQGKMSGMYTVNCDLK